MDVLNLVSNMRLQPKTIGNFLHNSTRRNFFLIGCYRMDNSTPLREVDQKFLLDGKIGFRDSYLDSAFCYSEVFRLHAILYHAAGAPQVQSGKGPGYCYMIGRKPNTCFVGHVTGLMFRL